MPKIHISEERLKNELSDYEEVPLPDTWLKISAVLDHEDAFFYKRKYRILKNAVLLGLFLLSVGSVYYYSAKLDKSENQKIASKDLRVLTSGTPNNSLSSNSVPSNNSDDIAVFGSSNKITKSGFKHVNRTKAPINNSTKFIGPVYKFSSKSSNFINKEDPQEVNAERIPHFNIDQVEKLDYGIKSPVNISSLNLLPLDTKNNFQETLVNPGPITNHHSFITVGFVATAKHTFNNILDNSPYNGVEDNTLIDQIEKDKICYNVGVSAGYHFNKKWGLESGIYYSNTSIDITHEMLYAFKMRNGDIGYRFSSSSGSTVFHPKGFPSTVNDSISINRGNEQLSYIKIPLLLNYTFQHKGYSITPSIGLAYNRLIAMKIKTEILHGDSKEMITVNKLRGGKKTYIGLMTNLNFAYKINSKVSFNLIPTFSYSITPVTENNLIKTYTSNLGLGLGLSYRL